MLLPDKQRHIAIWCGAASLFLITVCIAAYWGYRSNSILAAETVTLSRDFTIERDQAVMRGLEWLEGYLEDEDHFRDVGLDAVTIFLEASVTSRNPVIRSRAGQIARALARRLEQQYIRDADSLEKSDVTDILDFLAEAEHLGFDPTRLLSVAEKLFSASRNAEEIYGVPTKDVRGASEDTIYELLMCAYCLEKANTVYGDQFKTGFQLEDILRFLKDKPLTPYGETGDTGNRRAQEHAYLATHIAFVLNNYGRLRLKERDAPYLYGYLRSNFDAVLALEDIELVGEFVDVFRSMGFSSVDDDMVRSGTRFLLRTQNEDGSWGRWQEEEDPYDAIHYTWCAMAGLRDRTFLQDTPYSRRIRRILDSVVYR